MILSVCGMACMQGPHQLAQKSSTTTDPLTPLSLNFSPAASSNSKSGAALPTSTDCEPPELPALEPSAACANCGSGASVNCQTLYGSFSTTAFSDLPKYSWSMDLTGTVHSP